MRVGTLLPAILAASASAAYINKRQLAATPSASVAIATPTFLSNSSDISVDMEDYQPDAGQYYLGYRETDFAKPYAKYWNPRVAPISDEVMYGLVSSPWAAGLTFEANEAYDYMTRPGYLSLENGWAVTLNGTLMIAVRTEIPFITGEAYNWWFAWHLVETARYKLWNPVAHQYTWRYPSHLSWANKTYAEQYIGTVSFIDEYIGNDASKLTVAFIDPSELGFDKEKFDEQDIESIVTAHIVSGAHVTSGWDNKSYLMHEVRRLPNGLKELRSRFWLANYTDQVAHDLAVHCNIEMTRK
ncbi:MAG: hypothetical protein M1834_002596 [Cirrosporium novae-zelandiae]|nr:MAG: hypothetical protein M1834_002596 [Cirrosporium novae-zelandiae]